MTYYQRLHVSDQTPIGDPGPLPAELDGLAPESLVDLSWVDSALGYAGQGFVVAPDPPPGPPPVPDSVSIMRAQLVLDAAGQLDAVDAYMADPATPRAHKIIYAKTDKIWRDSEVLAVIAAVLGYDDDQLDDLFRAADALTL